jgi:TonB family protein
MVREQTAYLRPQHSVWFFISLSSAAHVGFIALLILFGTIGNNGYLMNNHQIQTVLKWGVQKPGELPDKRIIAVPKPPRVVRPSKNARVIEKNEESEHSKTETNVDYSEKMKQAISSLLTQENGRTSTDEKPAGFSNGSKAGDSMLTQSGDEYVSAIKNAIQANYSVPNVIRASERMFLRATVTMLIDSDGRVTDIKFDSLSGNQLFDDAVESTIRHSDPFPPPPEELVGKLSKTGITLEFDAKSSR